VSLWFGFRDNPRLKPLDSGLRRNDEVVKGRIPKRQLAPGQQDNQFGYSG
jgi:hypothetical protein